MSLTAVPLAVTAMWTLAGALPMTAAMPAPVATRPTPWTSLAPWARRACATRWSGGAVAAGWTRANAQRNQVSEADRLLPGLRLRSAIEPRQPRFALTFRGNAVDRSDLTTDDRQRRHATNGMGAGLGGVQRLGERCSDRRRHLADPHVARGE